MRSVPSFVLKFLWGCNCFALKLSFRGVAIGHEEPLPSSGLSDKPGSGAFAVLTMLGAKDSKAAGFG